ncbi:MAG TPA: CHASE2 domain-containing protein [Candidatus Omnitrophota bacterium]|nr:CHASE2 domain-containing protein [Candidatus Omnitrophota bacterium]HRZ14426.1 CHASE2 domain-containing protein [Candidatus Omnitrophota bacterium]
MKRAWLWSVAAAGVLIIGAAAVTGVFEKQEMIGYDWLMRSRPRQAVSPEIAIIEIDDSTLKELGRWPLPRTFHASLIQILSGSKARLIVFDILFSEPGKNDFLLIDALSKSGRVILPVAFSLREGAGLPAATGTLSAVAAPLEPVVAGIGQINIFVDADSKVRRVPLFVRQADVLWPSLGLAAAAGFLGKPPAQIPAPVDARGAFWVNFPGRWKETFKHYSYRDVLQAYVARQNNQPAALDLNVFKDKICFVGLTATGTSDFRGTPLEPVYPMVGAQASICDTILRQAFVKRAGPGVRALIAGAVFLAALWICLIAAPVQAGLLCIGLAALFTGAAWGLFSGRGIFIDLFTPLAGIAAVYVSGLLLKFLEETQKRRILEKELEIAASIQRSFLPADLRQIGAAQLRTFLKPAKFVGGDLYDVIRLDESTYGVFIGDVSGKGVPAALIMAQTISLLRVLAQDSRDPAQVLSRLNDQLVALLQGRFVTGQYLIVHGREGFWEGACAGHPALLYTTGAADRLEELCQASAAPLGLMPGCAYTTVRRQVMPGDRLFMYTDGWTEGRNGKQQEFGTERLKETFYALRGQDGDAVLRGMEAQFNGFQGSAPQYDDLTAVILAW